MFVMDVYGKEALMKRMFPVVACAVGVVMIVGCGESGTTEASGGSSGGGSGGASPAWLLASSPGESMSVTEARANAKEGETVAVRGVIGGRVDALSEGAGVFVMMDDSIGNSCLIEGDHCPTPWDYCCTPSEVIAGSNATVQLVDAGGGTVKRDLREFGIEELDRVVVVGAVGPRPSAEVLNIRATRIFVEGR